jgi:hypothetical protein
MCRYAGSRAVAKNCIEIVAVQSSDFLFVQSSDFLFMFFGRRVDRCATSTAVDLRLKWRECYIYRILVLPVPVPHVFVTYSYSSARSTKNEKASSDLRAPFLRKRLKGLVFARFLRMEFHHQVGFQYIST